jgi:hypothetical protein
MLSVVVDLPIRVTRRAALSAVQGRLQGMCGLSLKFTPLQSDSIVHSAREFRDCYLLCCFANCAVGSECRPLLVLLETANLLESITSRRELGFSESTCTRVTETNG